MVAMCLGAILFTCFLLALMEIAHKVAHGLVNPDGEKMPSFLDWLGDRTTANIETMGRLYPFRITQQIAEYIRRYSEGCLDRLDNLLWRNGRR